MKFIFPGDYFTPDPTQEIPYPVRRQATAFMLDDAYNDLVLNTRSVSAPTADQKVQARVQNATLPQESTSAPGGTRSNDDAGQGGSAPNINFVPNPSDVIKSMMGGF